MGISANLDVTNLDTEQTREPNRFGAAALLLAGVLCLGLAGAAQADPCEVPDAGGTVILPPAGCDYLSPDEVHLIIDGLPPDTTIELAPIHKSFICLRAMGAHASRLHRGDSAGHLRGARRGSRGQRRLLRLGARARGQRAPACSPASTANDHRPGDHRGAHGPAQSRAIRYRTSTPRWSSSRPDLFGDPDFAQLNITGRLPASGSPAPVTRPSRGSGRAVTGTSTASSTSPTSIDFVGAPGSVLDGMGGTTTATVKPAGRRAHRSGQSLPGARQRDWHGDPAARGLRVPEPERRAR